MIPAPPGILRRRPLARSGRCLAARSFRLSRHAAGSPDSSPSPLVRPSAAARDLTAVRVPSTGLVLRRHHAYLRPLTSQPDGYACRLEQFHERGVSTQ